MNIIEQLREQVEAKHKEALAAIETLAAYLSSSPTEAVTVRTTAEIVEQKLAGTYEGTNREMVLAVLKKGWQTVDELCKQTGLNAKQVHGVLHAIDIKEGIEQNRSSGSSVQYRLKEEVQRGMNQD
jgi:predicted Rossmann fold nucleotide-binding protein DprA/Smf involved in DNA uptake